MLGFSHITWPMIQVTKGEVKEKLFWFKLVSSSIVAIMLQLLGLPSLILSTRLFVTNLEATVLYAQVLVLVAAVTWSAGTSL